MGLNWKKAYTAMFVCEREEERGTIIGAVLQGAICNGGQAEWGEQHDTCNFTHCLPHRVSKARHTHRETHKHLPACKQFKGHFGAVFAIYLQ